jgi:hypothetical protein
LWQAATAASRKQALTRASGLPAGLFIEWWQDDLDDAGRALVTMRGLERLIGLHLARQVIPGVVLEDGLPYLRERVGVSLVELEARLSNQPMARLRQIVAKVDEFAETLARGEDAEPEAHATVYHAFTQAEISQLEEARDVCVRLLPLLAQQHQVSLMRQKGTRQAFWYSVLGEAKKAKSTS